MNKVELLLPAGDKEKAYYALNYGADAIFLGAKSFSLRARASNFEINDIKEIVEYAHSINKRVYLVTNIICRNFLATDFMKFFEQIAPLNIDGFISADPFIIKTINDKFPNCAIHISTQQSITNSKAALFFKKYNASRVVLAREMTKEEIKATTSALKNKMEIEIFIHGAVCIAFSGRCMMSNNFCLRDSNVGGCAQSCRWMYHLNDYNVDHFFTMSAKDMTYIKYLDELIDMGVSCFKVEGRMKSLNYVTTVAKTYRNFIDDCYTKKLIDKELLYQKLLEVANRDFDDAFLINANKNKMLYHDVPKNVNQNYVFVIDKKLSPWEYEITSKNNFDKNMKIKIITPHNEYKIKVVNILDVKNNLYVSVVPTPMSKLIVTIDMEIEDWEYGVGKSYE